ncbi:MAG TPA: hypothetical protein VGB24_21050 [Longimicrobium sp.]|jgi:hypothetical protein
MHRNVALIHRFYDSFSALDEDFGEAFTPEMQELEDRLRAEVAARQ